MTYAIIAVVLLVVVLLFALMSRKSADTDQSAQGSQSASKPAQKLADSRPNRRAPRLPPLKRPNGPNRPPESRPPRARTSARPPRPREKSRHPRLPHRLTRATSPGFAKGSRRRAVKAASWADSRACSRERKSSIRTIADQVEEILLTSDVGVATTQAILSRLREGLEKNELASSQAVWDALRADATRILSIGGGRIDTSRKPTVVFMVGVNGVGKTTTIGKLATKLKAEGKTVLLAAGDTFRAAAVQQLEVWGKRVGCEVVKGKEGADPGAVIFDAIQKAKEAGIDVVLADTAGRLQTKTPLMDELKKIVRTMQKALDGAPHETLLVLDATNGQNAISQAKMFQEAIPLTGIVLTKLDGTAKGGVILGICDELKIPVRYVGLGERADDLREFVADEFRRGAVRRKRRRNRGRVKLPNADALPISLLISGICA